MEKIRTTTDPIECRNLWKKYIQPVNVTDFWEVRECFANHYDREPFFVVAEQDGVLRGLLPLCLISELDTYVFFPGETYQGKTWLEQNPIFSSNESVFNRMVDYLNKMGKKIQIRYLIDRHLSLNFQTTVDETGYLFFPTEFDYQMDNYFEQFSKKSLKKLNRLLREFDSRNIEIKINNLEDFDVMVKMNIDTFEDSSYFFDPRFRASFRDLTDLFFQRGWLRITSIYIDDEPAAIDLGSVFNGIYTLFCGGVNPLHSGIAKYINLFHMRWACQQTLQKVDFLCGEFFWKPLFHLTPRPLYLISADEPKTDYSTAFQYFDTTNARSLFASVKRNG